MGAHLAESDPTKVDNLRKLLDSLSKDELEKFEELDKTLTDGWAEYQQLYPDKHPEVWEALGYEEGKLTAEKVDQFVELQKRQSEIYYRYLFILSVLGIFLKAHEEEMAQNKRKETTPPAPPVPPAPAS